MKTFPLALVLGLVTLAGCVEQEPNGTIQDAATHNAFGYDGKSFEGSGTVTEGSADPADVFVILPAASLSGTHQIDFSAAADRGFAGVSLRLSQCTAGTGACGQPGARWDDLGTMQVGRRWDDCPTGKCRAVARLTLAAGGVYAISVSNVTAMCQPYGTPCAPHDPIHVSYDFRIQPGVEREPNDTIAAALVNNTFTLNDTFAAPGQIDPTDTDVWVLRPAADVAGPHWIMAGSNIADSNPIAATISECQPDGTACTILASGTAGVQVDATIRTDRIYMVTVPPTQKTAYSVAVLPEYGL